MSSLIRSMLSHEAPVVVPRPQPVSEAKSAPAAAAPNKVVLKKWKPPAAVTSARKKGNRRSGNRRGLPPASAAFGKDEAKVFALNSLMPNLMKVPPRSTFFEAVRMGQITAITSSASVNVYGAYTFELQSVAGYTDFTALFDQYRIAQVEIWCQPRDSSVTQANYDSGTFLSVVDRDDATAPTTVSELLQYDNVMVTPGVVGHYRKFVPSAVIAAEDGAGTFTDSMLVDGWVDCNYPGAAYYGFKFGWTVCGGPYNMDVFFRLHLQFRTTR